MSAIRLLVVEDSAQDRQLFECLLEDFRRQSAIGVECEVASSGPQALEWVDRRQYDAIILDQHMPEMSGSEVLHAVKALFRQRNAPCPKVLAYSSLDVPEFRQRCLAEGADAFASKYMGTDELARLIGELGLDRDALRRIS